MEPTISVQEEFRLASPSAEDLLLPSIEAVVKHLARVMAERDYQQFVASERLANNNLSSEEGAP